MKGIRFVALATAVLTLAVLGCSLTEGTPTPLVLPTTAPVVDTPVPPPTEVGPAGTASLEITNNSGTSVWYIYISPTSSDQWGNDWLGSSVIPDGETFVVTDIPEGEYDLKAEDQDHNTLETLMGIELVGRSAWTITGQGQGGPPADQTILEVINNADEDITHLYISSTDSTTWGSDWLASGSCVFGASPVDLLAADGGTCRAIVSPGTYDLKVTNADDETVEVMYNVDVTGEQVWRVWGKTDLPGNAVLRFEEDFTDNRNNWGLNSETENVFYMSPSDGEYCILIKSNDFTAWEWYEPFRTDEFVAEVACETTGGEGATCGLGFGPDGENIYWYEVSATNQQYALFMLKNGSWQTLIDWTVDHHITQSGRNYLSMERLGNTISLYVNAYFMGDAPSNEFPQGRVGIGGATYSDGNITVCLDNLRVWRLE